MGEIAVIAADAAAKSRILIIDDEPSIIDALRRALGMGGFRHVTGLSDPRGAIEAFEKLRPDLVLLDLHMPYLDGFQVLEALGDRIETGEYLPVLMLTGDPDPVVERRALAGGARDFVAKPVNGERLVLRVRNLLETRALHRALQGHADELEQRVRDRTSELAAAQIEIVERLARAAEYRDDITGDHTRRVGLLSAALAAEAGWSPERVDLIRLAAPLHDVGKIGVPDRILLKAGPLDDLEWQSMKRHAMIGARILAGSGHALLHMAADIARSHHERWDGSGYPDGLAGDSIPAAARIVSIVDAFDAMIQERPYKPAGDPAAALAEIEAAAGTQFDPTLVGSFRRLADATPGGTRSLAGLAPPDAADDAGGSFRIVK
ncbi:MAG: HD domain-containing protein [Gemmatimonadetes bacterium]|nr:HD domain-containing protein [Gemmatimonadota bacterium]